jgi:hypothetical protein
MQSSELGIPGRINLRRLFDEISTANAFGEQQRKALAAVAAYPSDALLISSPGALADRILAEFRINPLTLHWDVRSAYPAESSVDVEAEPVGNAVEAAAVSKEAKTAIAELIPFSGPPGLFDMRPSDPPPEAAYGTVRPAGLVLAWVGDKPDPCPVVQFAISVTLAAGRCCQKTTGWTLPRSTIW